MTDDGRVLLIWGSLDAYLTADSNQSDRFHGQSEEVIDESKNKFHEIKSAYEIIVMHKGFK